MNFTQQNWLRGIIRASKRPIFGLGVGVLASSLWITLNFGRFSSGFSFTTRSMPLPGDPSAGVAGMRVASLFKSQEPEGAALYANFLTTRRVTEGAANRCSHQVSLDRLTSRLSDAVLGRPDSIALRIRRGKFVRDAMTVELDQRLGLVSVNVTLSGVGQSELLATCIRRELALVITQRRTVQANEDRVFFDERVAALLGELRLAEDSLSTFVDKNRSWERDPPLSLEVARLRRSMDMKQTTYSLAVGYFEQVRGEQLRFTPSFVIVDEEIGSAQRAVPIIRTLLVGLGLGLICGILIQLAPTRELFHWSRLLAGAND